MPGPEIAETVVVVTEPFEGLAVDRWANLINDAVQLRPGRLVIDLQRSALVDAAAIAVLLQAHRSIAQTGGSLALRAPNDRVQRILRLARLAQVFEIEDARQTRAGTP
jgi:anti-anti-sigma factor